MGDWVVQEEATQSEDLEEEGEDFVEGELLDSIVLDDEAVAIELDEDALAAIEAAKEFVVVYGDELLAEADFEGDENSSAEGIAARADGALDRILRKTSEAHVDAVAALAGDDVQEAEGVEDRQGPAGFRKYDEDEDTGLSQEDKDAVAQFKLTKTELANLVPQV